MKRNSTLILLAATAAFAWSGATLAQTASPGGADDKPAAKAEAKPEAPKKVYHAGGRHDQKGHEAAVRAKEQGKKMEEPAVHPGGKHDERGHKAAINAEQKTTPPAK
jgi:hypothetical protein